MQKYLSVVVCTLLVLLGAVTTIECLQCTPLCHFISNISALPDHACIIDQVSVNSSFVCTVRLYIDFSSNQAEVEFNVVKRSYPAPTSLSTLIEFKQTYTIVIVEFSCSTTDDCTRDFARESLNEEMANLSMNTVFMQINNLLHNDTSPAPLRCANGDICQYFHLCKASLTYLTTSNTTYVNSLGCQQDESALLTIQEKINMEPVDPRYITAELWCDIENGCDTIARMQQVYQLAKDGFFLPLNYSAVSPWTPTTTMKPISDANWLFSLKHLPSIYMSLVLLSLALLWLNEPREIIRPLEYSMSIFWKKGVLMNLFGF